MGEDRFRRRVEHWRELALRILPEIHTVCEAIESNNQRYFEGQRILFPAVTEAFDDLLALVDKTVGIYNEALACSIERVESLLNEAGDGHRKSSLAIGLSGLIENVQGAGEEQVAYLVDMAKADALGLLGENRQALELVDRHV